MSEINLIPLGLSSCILGAPGANILHTSKISSNEFNKQLSFKSSGNICLQIDENPNFNLFSPYSG